MVTPHYLIPSSHGEFSTPIPIHVGISAEIPLVDAPFLLPRARGRGSRLDPVGCSSGSAVIKKVTLLGHPLLTSPKGEGTKTPHPLPPLPQRGEGESDSGLRRWRRGCFRRFMALPCD